MTPAADGQLSILRQHVRPPLGRPISIGGYAAKASLRSSRDPELTRSIDLEGDVPALETLPSGDYELEVTVHASSDVVMVDQNGNVQRDLGPISARCNATVRITAGERTSVLVTAVGGDVCTIASTP